MCMNGLLVVMAFGPLLGLWPSSSFVLLRDHGPISCQNTTCSIIQDKIENGQVRVLSGGLVHESSRRIYKTTPNHIVKWVLKERQH